MERYLVQHDYGMGGLWWWITASSAEEIVLTLTEVEVVTEPDTIRVAETWDLEEVRLNRWWLPAPLRQMRAQRRKQRRHPSFGALAGRDRVYLPETEDGFTSLMELGPDGRILRCVFLSDEGPDTKSDDWPINPPYDLHAPEVVAMEMDRAEFEAAWAAAVPEPDHEL